MSKGKSLRPGFAVMTPQPLPITEPEPGFTEEEKHLRASLLLVKVIMRTNQEAA